MGIISLDDKKLVLDSGLVFIQGKLFVIQDWESEVKKQRKTIYMVPVWANLWDVPKEL